MAKKKFTVNAYIRPTTGKNSTFYPAIINITADFLPPVEDVRTALRAEGFLLNTVQSITESK